MEATAGEGIDSSKSFGRGATLSSASAVIASTRTSVMAAYQGRPTVLLTGQFPPPSVSSTFPTAPSHASSLTSRWKQRTRPRYPVRPSIGGSELQLTLSQRLRSEILLSQSYNVLSLSRTTPPELDALSARYPGALIISKGDVSRDEDNKQAVNMCLQSFGRLDALIRAPPTNHRVCVVNP